MPANLQERVATVMVKIILKIIRKYILLLTIFLSMVLAGCIRIPTDINSFIQIPSITKFEATPSVIDQGEVSHLSWNVVNTASISIDNGIGNVAASSTLPVTPAETTYYTLTARNTFGVITARTQIIVRVKEQSETKSGNTPLIVQFSSNRNTISPSESATLSWEVLSATDVVLSPVGKVQNKGETVVSPDITTLYVLSASNSFGEASASIVINVISDTSSSQPNVYTVTLNAISDESGALIKGTQYLDYSRTGTACAGDTDINLASRAFLSFDISSIERSLIDK